MAETIKLAGADGFEFAASHEPACPPREAGARDAGKLRQEGKEYVVKDGDVMNFRFNV